MRKKRKRKPGRSSSWIRIEKRWSIYARDSFVCVWCGLPSENYLTLDHLFPRGSPRHNNDERFLVTSCFDCNSARKNTPVRGWLRWLRENGRDVAGIVERLRARRRTLDRSAGLAALQAHRTMPPFDDSVDVPNSAGGVPF